MFDYSLIRAKRKTIQIRVHTDTSVTVRAPKWLSQTQIHRFVASKSHWVLKKQQEFKTHLGNFPTRTFHPGDYFLVLGRYYPAIVQPENEEKGIRFGGDAITLHPSVVETLEHHLIRWYRAQALAYFKSQVAAIANAHKLSFSGIGLSNAKTSWGACTAQKKIRLNWRLFLAPEPVIHYVICHELAHTQYLHHQKTFWALVARMCPEWNKYRKWLAKNGHFLEGGGIATPPANRQLPDYGTL